MHDTMSKAPATATLTHSWTAAMVRPLADGAEGHAASFLSSTFRVASVGGTEVLRISAPGLYRAFINGVRVGDDLLTPGWTVYDKRLSYQDLCRLRPSGSRG